MASVDRLNVLFVCTDQQRSDWLGFDPDLPIETPAVKRLADRGRQFTDAVCPTPICNPCRANIVSGMEYDRCGVPNNEVDYEPDGQRSTGGCATRQATTSPAVGSSI